jgi:lipooligosaccharide transport system permease protein
MALAETTRPPATPGRPPTSELVLRAFAFWIAQYRRTWRGTAVSTILEPLAFLAAMGLGLGALVNQGHGSATVPGGSYLDFIAPGLLAATAMQAGSFESTYPVMGAIKWNKQYHAMLATPLRVADALAGHLLFVLMRLAITCTVFFGVMVLFRTVESPWGFAAVPVAMLTGMAYATPIFAFAATRENDTGFAMLFRFGIVPMFLFSGTFFPISQLPDWMQPIAWAVPLWHGVSLCRALTFGTATWGPALVHVGYLGLWLVVSFAVALRTFKSRLVT